MCKFVGNSTKNVFVIFFLCYIACSRRKINAKSFCTIDSLLVSFEAIHPLIENQTKTKSLKVISM